MSTFPNLSYINGDIVDTINSRKNNVYASTLMPWIRLSTAIGFNDGKGGLIIESLPFKKEKDKETGQDKTFSTDRLSARYGTDKSGRIGTDFKGNSIYTDGETRVGRPQPIISALSIKNGQEGLSKHAEFVITCHTLEQLNFITKRFLEPGFMVLVEFGWNTSLAISQKVDLRNNPICEMSKYNSYDYLQSKKNKSKGTYDAFLGYITGGDIKSGDGDVYQVSVKLTTIGELPSYYQRHIATNSPNEKNTETGKPYPEFSINKDLEEAKDIGRNLFKIMYNDLPKSKQTDIVKSLADVSDVMGNKFSNPVNFLNFDKEIQETLAKVYSDSAKIKTDRGSDESFEMPEGAELVDSERFIRLELAFAILNTTDKVLKQVDVSSCKGVSTYNFEINTNDCICRAFPNIFSTDKSILYIPNPALPTFNLKEVLTSDEPIGNIISVNEKGLVKRTVNGNLASKSDFKATMNNSPDYTYGFPHPNDYNSGVFIEMSNYTNTDADDFVEKSYPAKHYGWLRNLYINFDFFVDVIGRDSYTTLDVYYEILNSISSAVNNQWVFEIVEQDSPITKSKELAVKELTFSGTAKSPYEDAPKFWTKGKNTPFIESDLDVTLPAALKSSIVGARLSNAIGESNDTMIQEGVSVVDETLGRGLFSQLRDPLLEMLSSFNPTDSDEALQNAASEYEPTEEEINAEYRRKYGAKYRGSEKQQDSREVARQSLINKRKEEAEEETKQKNFDLFTQNAGVYPMRINRKDINESFGNWFTQLFNDPSSKNDLEDYLLIGTYNDASAFRMVYMSTESKSLGILMPINFTFSVHGVSGLRVGDIFALNDLPDPFTSSIFQILEVSHEISNGQWLTTARAGFRNI